ncbi:MAG TPA: FAD-dependent monooxygenase, partial [Polyangiaceae bacterium]
MAVSPKNDADVLIVGAGPTGLMLACELHRAGVSFRILEKTKEPSTRSRALVVHAKTLELFQKLGIDQDLVICGTKNVSAHAFVNGQHAADFEIGDTGIEDTPYPFMLFVSQAETERVLETFLSEAKVMVERGVEAVEVDPTFGEVKLSTGESVRPRFVVGCDGAHSVVRHAGKFSFDGEPYPQDFLLADVHLKTPIDGLHLFFDDRGIFVVLPLTNGVYRIISSRVDRHWRSPSAIDAPDTTADPTLPEVQALADTFSSKPIVLTDPVWLARFRLHHRQADRYRRGPLLLAGDAAHIHSPAGGQGMNTGIQDAANLAWKLAMVCRNDAPETLLDSYDEERHPV